jgi:hypothetical protein
LRVEWPSDTVQGLHNIAPRRILTNTEPPRLTATRVSGTPQFTLKGGRFMTYHIQGSTNLRDWSPVTSVTITDISGTALISDPTPAAGHKFYRAIGRQVRLPGSAGILAGVSRVGLENRRQVADVSGGSRCAIVLRIKCLDRDILSGRVAWKI